MEMSMHAMRIRVDRVVDFGTSVSLIGIESDTEQPIAVHLDYRPLAACSLAQHEAESSLLIEYDARGLTLTLDLAPTEAEEVTHG
jgi:hypothetical protein